MFSKRFVWFMVGCFAIFDTILLVMCLLESLDSSFYINEKEGLYYAPEYGRPVGMRVGDTQHYQLNQPDSDAEWAGLLPPGGHLVYTKDKTTGKINKYTVTMLHQFKCLDVIRQQYNKPQTAPLTPQTIHCMSYLRQTIMCQLNIGLEGVKSTWGSVYANYDTTCRDWSAIYQELERNQEAYENWIGKD